jgi:hypothetical protein
MLRDLIKKALEDNVFTQEKQDRSTTIIATNGLPMPQ